MIVYLSYGVNMGKYDELSDEELILQLRDGESEITDYIMNKYKNLVKSKARTMFILGGENEDLIQEGMIGLFKAIRDYDAGRDASFFTFADLCITRQMYTAIQAYGRKKHLPLNTYISIYENRAKNEDDESGKTAFLVDIISPRGENNPEKIIIDKESVEMLEETIQKELSPLENQVLDLLLTGLNYVEIARVLGRDPKSTDNALQRIRGKLKKARIKL